MDAKAEPVVSDTAKARYDALEAELHGFFLEDLEVGMTAVYSRTITDADIVLFAGVSGDTNPLHLSCEFADGSRFEGRVAHGMLTAGLISTVIGTKLPGPGCIYMSQNLRFMAPVRAGDPVLARATITDINLEKQRVTMETVCSVDGEPVIEGDALIKVPSRSDAV